MGNLKFGDVYTKDLDLIIQAPPVYNFPAKDLSTEHIPGSLRTPNWRGTAT